MRALAHLRRAHEIIAKAGFGMNPQQTASTPASTTVSTTTQTATSAQQQTSRALKSMHLQTGSVLSAIKRNLVEVHYPTRPSKFFYVLWESEPPYNTHKLHFIVTSIKEDEVELEFLDHRDSESSTKENIFRFKPYPSQRIPAVVVADIRNRFNELLSASWLQKNLQKMPTKKETKEIIDYMERVLASVKYLRTGRGSPQQLNQGKLTKASYTSLSNKLWIAINDIFERPSARGLSIWDEVEQFKRDKDYGLDRIQLVEDEIIYFKEQIRKLRDFQPPSPPQPPPPQLHAFPDLTADESPL